MSTIRKQSIISSLVIYIGFAVGLLNTYFFTRQPVSGFGSFTSEQYGLTGIFIAVAGMMASFASLGMPGYIFKFYPYYYDHVPPRKNDMMTWALLVGTIGFVLIMVAGIALKAVIARKFSANSPLLVHYYYWMFALGFGFTIYSILEAYAWNLGKSVFTNFLKEVEWRLLTTILIVLFTTHVIKDFDLFIKLFAFTYPGIAITLFIYLIATKKIHLVFSISKVTRRYLKRILRLCSFVYFAAVIYTLSQVFDTIVIASVLKDGTAKAGIFGLAQIMGSIIQAPQRGVISASMGHLSRAWKEKNMVMLQRVYQRSSINMLIFSSCIFALITLNYTEAIITFQLKDTFLLGFNAFVLIGFTRLIDMGTGVNSQIIITSNYWKFELYSGIILLVIMLPLTYILTKQYDILGPGIAMLISITIYNGIRILFLWKKFRLFPFTIQSVYTLLLAAACFTASYFLFVSIHGWTGLVLRSLVFCILFGTGVIYLKLTPDIKPVLQTISKRLNLGRTTTKP
jgi:O-antigen/teichoic acid export membrane protein